MERIQMKFRRAFIALLLFASITSPLARAADAYPSKPLRLIVPFAPGGAADILGRVVADNLQRELGKPIVLVNREGAGTIIGVEAAAKSTPDGYTLLLSGDAATINTASGRPLPYDLMRDLKPITLVFSGTQFVLAGIKDSRFNSLQDLIKYAKANPGTLKFGTSGVATATHLSTETINAAAGIKALHVPYKGVAPAMNNLQGGHVDYAVAGSTAAVPAVQGGQLKALAVTSRTRSSALPQVPTLIEQGVQAETGSWYGLLAPARTPPEILQRLHGAMMAVLKSPEVIERLKALGGDAKPTTPEQAADFMREEIKRFGALMRKLDIKVTE
jgi:tripartite-type tricarboxylate transporter receptor subunit TctC